MRPAELPVQTNQLETRAVPLVTTEHFRWGGIILLCLFTLIYILTLDTGLQPHELHGGDLITHQYAQVQARPGNAPGYPIYTMGGWLWFHGWKNLLLLLGQPYPNPLLILSSYSTLWALLALCFFYLICGRLLRISRNTWPGALFCALLTAYYGVTYFFWYYATTTEQYSSAIAQTLAIFFVYLKWDEEPSRRSLLYLLALLCGLSLAHMLTVAFIVPPLVAMILRREPSLLRNVRTLFYSLAVAAFPLVSYVYVYLRGALNPNWWGRGHWDSPQEWFWWFVSTSQGREELAWAFEAGRNFFGNGFPEGIWQELSVPLLALGVVGIAGLPRRHAVVIYGTLLIYLIFCWFYRFGNWFQVILPAYPLILLGTAPLFRTLLDSHTFQARTGQLLLFTTLLVSIVWRASGSLPEANSRNRPEDTALDRAALLLDQPLPHDARLFAAVDDALAISYLTEIWGIRPDIKPVNSRDADDDLSEGNTVYSTVDALPALLPEINATPSMDGFSPDWIELTTRPHAHDQAAISDSIVFTVTPNLILADYRTTSAPRGAPLLPPTDPAIDVLLTWHLADGTWPQELSISLRPMSGGEAVMDTESGQPIQQDRPRPLYALWQDRVQPPSLEDPVVVHDPYRLTLPPGTFHHVDSLLLILYTQDSSGFMNVAEIVMPLSQ